MTIPDTTSAEAIDHYVVGKRIAASRGSAWRDVRLSVIALPPVADVFTMPTVTEPFIAWITSGEAEAQERESNGPWVTSRLKNGSLFVTAAGAPYEFRWRTLTSDPFQVVLVLLSLPLFNAALEDVFGAEAVNARLRDVSGFEDPPLTSLLQQLREEANRRSASVLLVRGIAQAIAVHLARNYTALTEQARTESSLPGFKLRRVTDWIAEHLSEEFSLPRLAEQAGMSEFHFNPIVQARHGHTAVAVSNQTPDGHRPTSPTGDRKERDYDRERSRLLESKPLRPSFSERSRPLSVQLSEATIAR